MDFKLSSNFDNISLIDDGHVCLCCQLTASRHELEEVCSRLESKVNLYQQRLNWLTSGSRQHFGVIQEKRVTVVVALGSSPSIAHDQHVKMTLSQVIREQVSQIESFNIIW